MANQRKVGLKIEIDGEAEYKKAIQNINKDNQLLNAELKTLAEQYKNNSDSMEYLTQKGEKLESKLVEAEAKVTLLKDALRKATEEYGTADERTTEWAIKLANAETELAKVNNAIADNNAALLENAGAMENNENAVAGLGDQLDQLGGMLGIHIPDMAREALNSMEGFSAGTVASMGLAAAGIGAAIKVTQELYDLTKQAAAEADALLTRSAQTGLSTDLLQQLDYAQNFLDFDGLDRSLQNLTRSMGNATTESTKQAQAFKELGVEIYDENGKLRDNYAVFLDVIDALGNMDDKTRADIIANQLFGKSYADLKPLIEAGSNALKTYTDRAQEMGYVIDREVVERLGRLDDALQENKTAFDTAKTELAGFFAPIFQSIVDGGTSAINVVRSLFGSDIVQLIAESSNPLVNIVAQWSHLADAYYDAKDAKDAFDESAQDTPDLSGAITPMQEAVQALADKYQEAQEKYRELLDGQFGLFDDASERLLTDSDRAAQALGEFWNSAYESAEKSIQGQFGLFDEASTEVTKTSEDIIKALESQITYWTQYEDNLDALLHSGIDGIQEFVAAHSDGSAKSVEAIAVMAAATDEQKEKILSTYQALEVKQADVAQSYANLSTAGAESSEALAGSTESYAQRTIAALESQAQYWQEYNADFDALKARNIEGIDELAKKYMDGSAESKAALAELRGASDEEIAAIIAKMHEVDTERGGLADTFAALDVDLSEQFAKIKSDWAGTVQEITGTEIDFGPFNEAVKASFGDLTETAKNTATTVKTELGSIPAEIAALQPLQEKQGEVGAGFAALKEAGAGSMAELAAATAESTDSITAAFDGQLAALGAYAEEFDALTSGGGESVAAMAERFTAAGTDAGAALQELAETATNVSAEVSDALAELATATAESTKSITAAFDGQLAALGAYAEEFDALTSGGGESVAAMAERFTAAGTDAGAALQNFAQTADDVTAGVSQDVDTMAERFTAAGTDAGAALQELAETATDVSIEVSDTMAVMEENFAVTCAGSEESLDALAVAADEKISSLIVTLAQTEAAKDDFVARFDELTENTVADLDQIQTETGEFMEEFNVIIASVDFSPFTDSVDSAFSFLEDRAWSSIDNVRGWLAELSAEIDAIEARAANVNVGHNAGGTDNWRGGLTYLAENGPELVDLPQGSRVHTAQETRQILGGGTDMRETEAKLDRAVSLLGQISAELSGLRVRGRMA